MITVVYAATTAVLALTIPLLINNFYQFQQNIDKINELENVKVEEYDFVLVGGGTAGCVVANRLSRHFRVLVLEAGGYPGPPSIQNVPLYQNFLHNTDMDYQYKTAKMDNSALAYVGQRVLFPRGKGLGGSSNINNMMYIRGHSKDFDAWAHITKSSIWSWKNVLKFFKKSEDYHGNYAVGSEHEVGNEFYVGKQSYTLPLQDVLLNALREKKVTVGDYNVLPGRVFGYPEVTIKNGARSSTYTSFLEPILLRPNLKIYTFAEGIKVHLSDALPRRAIGVTYRQNGKEFFVKAKHEVILSSGVVNSPKLLLLSGIGPKQHLNSVGVNVLVDLPVGESFVGHTYASNPFVINDTLSFVPDRDFTVQNSDNYYSNGKGPYTMTNARFGIGYTYSSLEPDQSWPDVYVIFNGLGGGGESKTVRSSLGQEANLKKDVFEKYYGKILQTDGFLLNVVCVKPKSKGYIRLASKNPEDKPIINPNFYADEYDMPCVLDGIEFIMGIINSSKAFQRVAADIPPMPFPGCESQPFKSREYWECHVRQLTDGPHDSFGGCQMGDGTEAAKTNSVVDPHLQVLDVDRLRVIDVSVIPKILTGSPQASAVLIGELGSHLVLSRWKE